MKLHNTALVSLLCPAHLLPFDSNKTDINNNTLDSYICDVNQYDRLSAVLRIGGGKSGTVLTHFVKQIHGANL